MVTMKYQEQFNKDYFESTAWNENNLICGVDEAGRGCLAGPLVAAAVILFPHKNNALIKDSKLLTEDELLASYQWLCQNSWHSFSIINNRVIDKQNIYQATLKTMKRAVMQLFAQIPQLPTKILIDAMPLNLYNTTYKSTDIFHFPFGESKSSSIAAASIIAKVKRDEIMRTMDLLFPHYQFAQHKGYGTALHHSIIQERGRSVIHRQSYLENLEFALSMKREGTQQNFLNYGDYSI